MKKCNECSLKHLAAALAYAKVSDGGGLTWILNDSMLCYISQAYVLASEAKAYPSHADAAVGMLVLAEEAATELGSYGDEVASDIRKMRLDHGKDPAALMRTLRAYPMCIPFVGHLKEAMREGDVRLPQTITMDWYEANYGEIIRTAKGKDPAEPPVDPAKKGGESVMAKSACAAKKGGCAKKAACKGGSCKTKKGKKGCK